MRCIADHCIPFQPGDAQRGFGLLDQQVEPADAVFALRLGDAVAGEDWIEQLMVPLLDDPDTGMCASKILFHGEDVIDKVGHLIYLDGQNRGRGTGERDSGQYDTREETLFPDGCAALYRRELLERELKRLGVTDLSYEAIAKRLGNEVKEYLLGNEAFISNGNFAPHFLLKLRASNIGRNIPNNVKSTKRVITSIILPQ